MEENRKYPRRKLCCPALFKGGSQALETVRVNNISRGGLFVETSTPTDRGENVIVNIDEYTFGRNIGIRGIVVRKVPEHGMGIQISWTTDDEYLREWITK